jgi:hypothetical protein
MFERNLMWMVLAAALVALVAVACQAAPINGVLVEERVVKLPEDGLRWHISVIGEQADARYTEVLGWFDSGKLKTLKAAVHFHAVPTTDPMYAERYKGTIKGLPTVRVQDAKGTVIYEAAKNLPMSGDALYNAIAASANGSEEWLPWRRKHASPQPVVPNPDPEPGPILDPEPDPLDDNNGAPIFEQDPLADYEAWAIGVCIALFVGALLWGQIESSKAYRKAKR